VPLGVPLGLPLSLPLGLGKESACLNIWTGSVRDQGDDGTRVASP
jgi:hypothetical protein